jgi:hypothetical protein
MMDSRLTLTCLIPKEITTGIQNNTLCSSRILTSNCLIQKRNEAKYIAFHSLGFDGYRTALDEKAMKRYVDVQKEMSILNWES